MPMTRKQKVVVYVVHDQKLLVFRHSDFSYEEVGIQVPAGTVNAEETTQQAALRELQEETGYTDFEIVRFLGKAEYDMRPYREEIQERYFFLAKSLIALPERWASEESHDAKAKPTRFECFWIPLENGHILQSGQGALLGKITGF